MFLIVCFLARKAKGGLLSEVRFDRRVMIGLICLPVPMLVLGYRPNLQTFFCKQAEQQVDETVFSAEAKRRMLSQPRITCCWPRSGEWLYMGYSYSLIDRFDSWTSINRSHWLIEYPYSINIQKTRTQNLFYRLSFFLAPASAVLSD